MKKLLLTVLLICIPIWANAEERATESVDITPTMKLVPQAIHEENKELNYTITATYPQIQGSNLPNTAITFNQLSENMTKKQVEQFKKYVQKDMPHMQTLPPEVRKNSFNVDYDVDVVKPENNTILSVRLSIEGYQAGRAHPYHIHQILNYDMNTSKVLTLSQLFKPRAKYLEVLAKYSKDKLNQKLEDKWMIADGTKPLDKNFEIWNLENDGLVLTFEEYQVAPYVYGSQEVEIPYTELKTLISPTAPIYPCVMNSKSCELVETQSSPQSTA